jgi:hypothetical protein
MISDRVIWWQAYPDPAAIIAGVASDPNKGEVWEVGMGNVVEIYIQAPIAPVDGSLVLTGFIHITNVLPGGW